MVALLHNDKFVCGIMALIIFLATFLFKAPIKILTKRVCKTEKLRKIANISILLIPFALGVALEFFYSKYYLKDLFDPILGLGYGTASISLYAIFERFFNVKLENPYNSDEGVGIISLIEEVSSDGKVDNQDADAVKEFLKKIK